MSASWFYEDGGFAKDQRRSIAMRVSSDGQGARVFHDWE